MLKYLIFGAIAIASVVNAFAGSPVYGSATSTDQLTYRVLDGGQVAWMEDDGSAVMYVGSVNESKNLKVTDPAALRGCRVFRIDAELSKSCSKNMSIETGGAFKFKPDADILNNPDGYEYHIITDDEVAVSGVDYYIKDSEGNYSKSSVSEGQSLPANTYYLKKPYWICRVMIVSKDSNIIELDYQYLERASTDTDFNLCRTSRTITYDGRYAYLDIKVSYGSPDGQGNTRDYFSVSNFSANTIGIGDKYGYINNLSKTKFYIHDSLCSTNEYSSAYGFDLYRLREWAMHLYDGNRGEHWYTYDAKSDVNMLKNRLLFSSVSTAETNKYAIGISGRNLDFNYNGIPFMSYRKSESGQNLDSNRIQITKFEILDSNECVIEFMSTFKVDNPSLIKIMHKIELDKGDYYSIPYALEEMDDTGMYFKATIPSSYYEQYNTGFFRIYYESDQYLDTLKIAATISVLGEDGKYYKLKIPAGGGAVTAELDPDQSH
jgi:hypothetical protein